MALCTGDIPICVVGSVLITFTPAGIDPVITGVGVAGATFAIVATVTVAAIDTGSAGFVTMDDVGVASVTIVDVVD